MELAGINRMADRRSIGGDVMRDELTEERPAGGLAPKRGVVVDIGLAVAQAAGSPKRKKKRLVGREGREIREQTPVRRGRQPRIGSGLDRFAGYLSTVLQSAAALAAVKSD